MDGDENIEKAAFGATWRQLAYATTRTIWAEGVESEW
jgi:hypothetical protein